MVVMLLMFAILVAATTRALRQKPRMVWVRHSGASVVVYYLLTVISSTYP